MKSEHVKRRYSLGVREEQAKLTHEAIRAAALQLFSERPFDLVSVDEIAEHADVTRQTVLRNFGSKEGLIAAIADEQLSRAHDEREALIEGHKDVERALRSFVAQYEQVADRANAFHEAAARYPSLQPLINRDRASRFQWLERLFASDLPTGGRRKKCIAQLYALLTVHAWIAVRNECGLSPEDSVETIVRAVTTLARSFDKQAHGSE